jgi:hypothetical protein
MKIDAAVKFVLIGVKSHLRPPFRNIFWILNLTLKGMIQGGLNEYHFTQGDKVIPCLVCRGCAPAPRDSLKHMSVIIEESIGENPQPNLAPKQDAALPR